MQPGGFLDVVSTRAVYIVSGGGKGSIYGVVHLLEKYFGCRKYSPTADFFPPRALALRRAFDVDNPVNDFRFVNGDFIHDPDYRDWMRLDATGRDVRRGLLRPYLQPAFALDRVSSPTIPIISP